MADIYRIAVTIALTNGMSSVLAIIGRDVMGLNTKVKDIEKGFGRWGLAIGGAEAVLGGAAIFGGMAKLAKHGAEANHQLELMKLQGMSFAEIQEASAQAMLVTGKVLTTNYADNLKHIRELRYAFGDTPDAERYLETVTKSNAILNALNGGKGAGGTDQVWSLVKALEEKGLTANPALFQSYVDQMTKAVVASGGRVTPQMFFSAFKYGRTAMLGWNEEFVTQYLPRLIQSWSGGGGSGTGGPGNALMSAFTKVVQGQMSLKGAQAFEHYGLGKAHHIRGSSSAQIDVKGAQQFAGSPYRWAQDVEVPALGQHGINLRAAREALGPLATQNFKTSEEFLAAVEAKGKAEGGLNKDVFKIIQAISQQFQVRTASSAITQMVLQGGALLGDLSPFEKDARLQREAFDQRMSYDELIKHDYATMMVAFHEQWKSLGQVVGQPLTDAGGPVLKVLASVTHLMNETSQLAGAHPEGVKVAIEIIAALGASLLVTGLVALAAAIAPLLGLGAILAGVAAGFAALAAINWGAITSGLASAASGIVSFIHSLGGAKVNPGVLVPGGHGRTFQGTAPAAAPGKQGWNVTTPPRGEKAIQLTTNLHMDGRKIAEAVTTHQVSAWSGPSQGSRYFDDSRGTMPLDTASANG
jgi:hypothetical protein